VPAGRGPPWRADYTSVIGHEVHTRTGHREVRDLSGSERRIGVMKRLLPLIVLALVPVPSAALADGCPPASCGIASTGLPGSRIVLVGTGGQQGPLHGIC